MQTVRACCDMDVFFLCVYWNNLVVQKEKVVLKIVVEYQIKQRSLREMHTSTCLILHEMDPPLYAKILGWVRDTPSTSPYVQPYSYQHGLHH